MSFSRNGFVGRFVIEYAQVGGICLEIEEKVCDGFFRGSKPCHCEIIFDRQ